VATDATALRNLTAIEALERTTGLPTRLVAVSGLTNLAGRLAGEGPWYYTFRDPGDAPATFYQWRVDAAGNATREHLGTCGFGEQAAGHLALDSDRAVAIALQAGGDALLRNRGVNPHFGVTYRGGLVRVRVFVPDCFLAYADLDALSGAVLRADFSCRSPFFRPCIGPGVY
jgi:hypothetical protein